MRAAVRRSGDPCRVVSSSRRSSPVILTTRRVTMYSYVVSFCTRSPGRVSGVSDVLEIASIQRTTRWQTLEFFFSFRFTSFYRVVRMISCEKFESSIEPVQLTRLMRLTLCNRLHSDPYRPSGERNDKTILQSILTDLIFTISLTRIIRYKSYIIKHKHLFSLVFCCFGLLRQKSTCIRFRITH